MATVTVPTTSTLPVAGGDIIAAPLNGWITNLRTFVEGNNIDENNVDYTNSDGIVVMGQAQTITGLKTFENTSAAAGGVRTAAIFSIDPASGTPADGDGVELLFNADDDEGNVATIGELEVIMTDTDNGDEDSEIKLKALIAGSAAEFMVAGTPADGAGRVVFNDGSADIDFRIETNNIANGFVVDAGLDTFAFGAAGADDKFVTISPPVATHSATVDTYALHVTAGGAQTIPSGTTALVASVAIEEPNITATGTVTNAATLYVKNAPTEGGSNYSLWVDDGAVKLDSTLAVVGVGTFTAQSVHTGGIQSGANIVSDTDGTDDLGTTSVRWANVYTDAVGDSGQALAVKATTLSFDAASTIDTSGNNALSLDAGSAVLTLDGGTIESDASTFSFDAAATIDTSGNNALSLDAGSAVLTLDGGTIESDASTLSFDAAATIDTSGNNNLTLNAGTGTVVVTAGDLTIFDDNNDADTSLSIGTSATEALVIQALNGGSDKTLEELRFTTKTASSTANHGKMSFYVDETNIGNINDGGITLESGMVLTGNVTGNASGTAATVTGGTQAAITACANLVTVGTIGTGTWQGGVIASAYLDSDTAHLSGSQTFTGDKTFTGTVTVGVNDTGKDVKFFGASDGAYMEWDESEDQLRIMGASADATTSTGKLLLATSLTDINANDVLGKVDFQAPHEAGGTDATAIAASIQAIAQSTFSASSNATDLIFYTGHSEAATEKFRFTSQGELGIGGANYGSDGQVLTSGGAGAAPAWENATGGHVIEEEGTSLTQRTKLNFIGASVTVTDDSADDATDVTIGTVTPVLSFTKSNGGTDNIALSTSAVGESLVTDTSPQLGGNLDVNGQSIVSASNGNIQITPNGTGSVLVGVDDTGHDVKFFGATSGKYMLWDESADTLNVVGNAGVGIARTDGTLHVHTATAGSVTAATDANDLVVESNGTGGISILTPDANNGKITFGSPSDDDYAEIVSGYNGGASYVGHELANGEKMRIIEGTGVYIAATQDQNSFMTLGISIDQAANDNEIMAFKSSEVSHNMTSLADADTYGVIQKQSGTAGGASLRGFADTANNPGVTVISYMTGINDTKSTSGNGAIGLQASLTNGSGGASTCASDDNLVCIHNHGTTRFIFDAEGSAHADVEWTTFDTHDDITMLHDIEATLVPDTFGKSMKYDQEYLMKIGILGTDSLHEEEQGRTRGMINTTKLQMLHHGAIRQVHQQLQDVKEFYEDKIAVLEQRLLRLEA